MTIEFETGILLCGKVRDFLERCKFEGMNIEWREGRGWISRDWIVKGNPADIQIINASLQQWFYNNGNYHDNQN
jgi:hypothetical protein